MAQMLGKSPGLLDAYFGGDVSQIALDARRRPHHYGPELMEELRQVEAGKKTSDIPAHVSTDLVMRFTQRTVPTKRVVPTKQKPEPPRRRPRSFTGGPDPRFVEPGDKVIVG